MVTIVFESFHIFFLIKTYSIFKFFKFIKKEKFFLEKNIYPTLNQISNSGFFQN